MGHISRLAIITLLLCFGCDSGTEGAKTGEACAESDLIAQCPANTTPELSANANTECNMSGTIDLSQGGTGEVEGSGSISRACVGVGACRVVCRFNDPCEFGVDSVSPAEGIRCRMATTACGNGSCEAGESAENCAVDCAKECTTGATRCADTGGIQTCDLRGFWGMPAACGANSQCTTNAVGEAICGPGFIGCDTDNGGCGDPSAYRCIDNENGPVSCEDIDECAENNGGCAQTCTNAEGSFSCGCHDGYTLNEDGRSCSDVDECAGENACAHECANTNGGFTCNCFEGYELNDDGHSCDDIDECAVNNGGCFGASSQCRNREGAAPECLPRDCEVENGGCDPVVYTCQVVGGIDDADLCVDINECLAGNGGCGDPRLFQCENRDGQPPLCRPIEAQGFELLCLHYAIDEESRAAGRMVENRCPENHAADDEASPWGADFSCADDDAVQTIAQAAWCYRSADDTCCYCMRDYVRLHVQLGDDCAEIPDGAFALLEADAANTTVVIPTTAALQAWACVGNPDPDGQFCDVIRRHTVTGGHSPEALRVLAAGDRPFIQSIDGRQRHVGLVPDSDALRFERAVDLGVHLGLAWQNHVYAANAVTSDDFVDGDEDGWRDGDDNCPVTANRDHVDQDADGVGDACDNCPTAVNANQENTDEDEYGDACDNCPAVVNPDQADQDADTVGDDCDNCPALANADQANRDGDRLGDACEQCPGGWSLFGGSCYIVPKSQVVGDIGRWAELRTSLQASGYCRNTGGPTGKLVSITSAEEDAFVQTLAPEAVHIRDRLSPFIGLAFATPLENSTWASQDDLVYTNWAYDDVVGDAAHDGWAEAAQTAFRGNCRQATLTWFERDGFHYHWAPFVPSPTRRNGASGNACADGTNAFICEMTP